MYKTEATNGDGMPFHRPVWNKNSVINVKIHFHDYGKLCFNKKCGLETLKKTSRGYLNHEILTTDL